MRILVNTCEHDARGKHACMLPIHDAVTPHPGPKQSLHKWTTRATTKNIVHNSAKKICYLSNAVLG